MTVKTAKQVSGPNTRNEEAVVSTDNDLLEGPCQRMGAPLSSRVAFTEQELRDILAGKEWRERMTRRSPSSDHQSIQRRVSQHAQEGWIEMNVASC